MKACYPIPKSRTNLQENFTLSSLRICFGDFFSYFLNSRLINSSGMGTKANIKMDVYSGKGGYMVDPLTVFLAFINIILGFEITTHFNESLSLAFLGSMIVLVTVAGIIFHEGFVSPVIQDLRDSWRIGVNYLDVFVFALIGLVIAYIIGMFTFQAFGHLQFAGLWGAIPLPEEQKIAIAMAISETFLFVYMAYELVEKWIDPPSPKYPNGRGYGWIISAIVVGAFFGFVWHDVVYQANLGMELVAMFAFVLQCAFYKKTKVLAVPLLMHLLHNVAVGLKSAEILIIAPIITSLMVNIHLLGLI